MPLESDLFSTISTQSLPGTPLAERLRPRTRHQFLGQPKVMEQIDRYLKSGRLPSLIFWGPPGSGKTSLAQALAQETTANFVTLNAVESGAKALKEIGEKARLDRLHYQQTTILFVDEIHRFNKAQQDVLLPFVEKGDLTLIGATTENPSYELNRALLSRCRLLVFERHQRDSLISIFAKVLIEDEFFKDLIESSPRNTAIQVQSEQLKTQDNLQQEFAKKSTSTESSFVSNHQTNTEEVIQAELKSLEGESQIIDKNLLSSLPYENPISSSESATLKQKTLDFIFGYLLQMDAFEFLISWADGDARRFLLAVDEILLFFKHQAKEKSALSLQQLKDLLGQSVIGYDRASDQHYDCASALIKSIRGSDADAALYYLARMLAGGEDVLFIARRLVILASEDIGNADPRALQVAVAGLQAVELVGLPEGAINLSQVVTYLASAPKSNKSYLALKKAQNYVQKTGTPPIPLKLRSADTPEMRGLGYRQGYQYPHDFPKNWVQQNYWPESLTPENFYQPGENGFEKQIAEYAKWLKSKPQI